MLQMTTKPVSASEITKGSDIQVRSLFLNLFWKKLFFWEATEEITWETATIIPKYCSGIYKSINILLRNVVKTEKKAQ